MDVIEKCLRERKELTWFNIIETIYSLARGCTNFKPTLAVGFIKFFGAKSVLDISSGWGDRLIGAIACGARYWGCDPNPSVHEGYEKIIDVLCPICDVEKCTLVCSPFESVMLPEERFDMILTSPPYFDVEKYCDDATQSTALYPSVDEWYQKFLITSLKKAWTVLNSGGHMVIHINDAPGKKPYTVRMRNEVTRTFDGAVYLGVMGKVNEGEKPWKARPVFIWKKR
jgi:hypothetical protein